jgi:hypothetical protein
MLGISNKVEKTKLFLNQGNETFKMELEVGLGAITEIIEVRIDWPGRKTQVYKGFDINNAWICTEGLIKPQLRKLQRNPLKGKLGRKACCNWGILSLC